MEQNLQITSLAQLQSYADGQIVELPPFADGQPFVARLRRPSMMMLAKTGQIPNELLEVANELFFEGKKESKIDVEALKNMATLMETFAAACFIAPTWDEIQHSGIQLTDEQCTFIYNYAQNGVRSLKNFR